MWKVGDIAPVSVLGVDGYPYGFNLTTEEGFLNRSRCTSCLFVLQHSLKLAGGKLDLCLAYMICHHRTS